MAPVPPEASVVQTGLGIRYIGEHCFSYSGLKNSGDQGAESTFLDFTSGNGYIFGRFQCFYATDSAQGSDMIYRIKFNDKVIAQYLDIEDSRMAGDPHQPIPVVIPPFTKVVVTIESITGAQQQAVTLTGRVYGAE